MDTKILNTTEIEEAAQLLLADQLVAFPTETVYGLGANGLSEEAVKKVFQAKGRPTDNPLILHVNSFAMVKEYVDKFHPLTEKIVNKYWPGPLTLIFKIKEGCIPSVVTGGLSTAAFRIPNNPKTLLLIEKVARPIVGPSANTSGKPSPTSAAHVFHDMNHKIAGILDDGSTEIGVESTVLDLSNPDLPPMILRPGAITQEELANYLQTEILLDNHLVSEAATPKSPGMKYKHYAPTTPVVMVYPQDWQQVVNLAKKIAVGIIAGPTIQKYFTDSEVAIFSLADDSVAAAAQGLFAGLRALDEENLQVIFAPIFSEEGLGAAYMNRLKKASNQNSSANYFEN
ncbi:L-threonylcarbamoyladenylate synthase [Enterococcus sp. PF1-24]|uniref:L-threonylcarbamoyladenylate synthase n=1 Tax=unclassified Enterococcus TaxID=2608891 RepID=UPI0024745CBC|nr:MULTISPECIES: L-threonylcarbamoyladenylate synthase [unclassified Enterococcus]MDH6365382.1 L-threonylcarbamoyladenylate synthase [Enterococcus sp. PFB1-1]MDH6402483.1 L-threonylcarbamoyladenylate synthase [Enterococcus sp. PF1-24]